MAITNQIPPQERKGFLVVVEGVDGVGKSSITTKLYQFLEDRGINTALTREPGSYSDEFCSATRSLIKHFNADINTLWLFLADRDFHCRNIITPLLNDGYIVVCDRFYLSTLIYQLDNFCNSMNKVSRSENRTNINNIDLLIDLNMVASNGVQPDLVVIPIVTNMDVLKARIEKQKSENDELSIQKDYKMLELYQNQYRGLTTYLKEKGYEKSTEYLFIDGEKDPDEIFNEVWSHIRTKIQDVVNNQRTPTL